MVDKPYRVSKVLCIHDGVSCIVVLHCISRMPEIRVVDLVGRSYEAEIRANYFSTRDGADGNYSETPLAGCPRNRDRTHIPLLQEWSPQCPFLVVAERPEAARAPNMLCS